MRGYNASGFFTLGAPIIVLMVPIMDTLIAMGTKVNASIKDVFSFVALAVAPFNVIKAVIDGVITVVLYKYLSHQLKA